MDKRGRSMILVDVYVPSVDDKFDFTIDENTLVRKVIEELSGIISKKMKNSNVNQRIEFDLYDIKKKNHIDNNKTLFECGIRDGDQLMIV